MADDNDCLNPMDEVEKPFIEYEDEEIFSQYWCDPNKLGKWELFYPQTVLNEKWHAAVALYRAGQISGIQSMKCSTGAVNSSGRQRDRGVIMFACGPYEEEETVLQYGRNLVEKMSYCNAIGTVTYKTDKQSTIGKKSIFINKNYYYKIPVPTDEDPAKANTGVKPSLLHETQHIFENIKSISSECPENANQGFWLMIIGKKYMDTFWLKACRLYRDLELPGIAFLKATPGRAGSSTGTIRFFCGPIRDLSRLERIGINLSRKLNYKNPKEELQFRVQNSNANQSTVFYTVKVPKLSDARYAN